MNGILVIKKEKGYTSRDVVNRLMGIFHTRKIGHTGTLDPMAEGVLVVAMGSATKLIELLTSETKEYYATVRMGIETDTLDTTGTILKEENTLEYDLSRLKEVIFSFIGTYQQEVPRYSAVKVQGKRLFNYARNNEEVTLPSRPVTITSIKLEKEPYIEAGFLHFSFSCTVSKGTYIRSLIRDMGLKYGLPFSMSALTRTKQGSFSLDDARLIDEVTNQDIHSIKEVLLPIMDLVTVNEWEAFHMANGMPMKRMGTTDKVMIQNEQQDLIAIYQEDPLDKDKMRLWKSIKENNNHEIL